jgi:hypothetical protein
VRVCQAYDGASFDGRVMMGGEDVGKEASRGIK